MMPGMPPILLVHGFGRCAARWAQCGWTSALEQAGLAFTAIDLPGHGDAAKPHDPAAYEKPVLLAGLLAELGDEPTDVIGYSLGAELSLELALAHPDRVRRLVIGGIGTVRPFATAQTQALWEAAAAGTEPAPGTVRDVWARAASEPGSDGVALAACMAGVGRGGRLEDPARFPGPTLVFGGTVDPVAEGAAELVAALPGGELLWLEGHDHHTAFPAEEAQRAAVELLTRPATL
jgi:pimeloyl-ACP methyl ester carboxylesterase